MPRHVFLGVAGVVAAGLVLQFVQVCHESVAQGERWRVEQRRLVDRAPGSAAVVIARSDRP